MSGFFTPGFRPDNQRRKASGPTPEPVPQDIFVAGSSYQGPPVHPVMKWLGKLYFRLFPPSVAQAGFLAPAIHSIVVMEKNRVEVGPVDYVGGRNDRARVVVIDSFSRDSDQKIHGDHVTGVLQRVGDLKPSEIQRIDYGRADGVRALLRPGPESAGERLDAFIRMNGLLALEDKNKILRELQKRENLDVVNMSLGISTLGTAEGLFREAMSRRDSTGGAERFFFDAVELPCSWDPINLARLRQALIDRVHNLTSSDPEVLRSRREFQRLSSELKQRGVSFVVAAGNDGELASRLRAMRYRLPEGAAVSYFHNRDNIVVGAIDDKGTADPYDDELAGFSTPSPYVRYLANGTNVPVDAFSGGNLMSGTSFAAPIVSGKIARLKEAVPAASADDLGYLIANHPGVKGSDLPVVDDLKVYTQFTSVRPTGCSSDGSLLG